jgi:hypothetical protein
MAAFILAALLLAGCLRAFAPTGGGNAAAPGAAYLAEVSARRLPAPDFDFTKAIDPDHGGLPAGHSIAALHTGSHGLRLVGYNPLGDIQRTGQPPGPGSAFTSLDVWGHYVCVAHWVGPGGVSGGATVLDISDPARPTVLWTVGSGSISSDCQFTDDGDHLLVASSGTPLETQEASPPPDAGNAGAKGLAVYDVRDKAHPRFLFTDATGDGDGLAYHNVFTATIAGTDYVFQTYSGNILALDAAAGRLRLVAKVDVAAHDVWVGRHPVTGQWVMASGAGNGTVLYGLDDPAHPVLLSTWEGDGSAKGWHRQWPVLGTVGGRAYLVVAGETTGPPEPYTVLDFTDPTRLEEVGHWELPGDPAPGVVPLYTFSPHEFETWDGYVASANYHAGVWVFDVGSPERAKAPVTLGYYLPHEIPQVEGGTGNTPWAMSPWVWGAAFDDRGYILSADLASGFYVLAFDATRP